MTENLLSKALCDRIRIAASAMLLEAEHGKDRPISIHEGFLPVQRQDNSEAFPFIVVRPVSGRMEQTGTSCSVDILCGCRGREETGYQFAVNAVRRIADSLLELPYGVLDGRFVLEDGMEWELVTDRPYPDWLAVLHTAWTFRTPEAPFER